ncbi:MAG: hypothetical protein M3Z35_11295 [Nitrospirota bacterium]|nr:hypothetical protein [Nitrospirota bacterium]
MSEQEPTEFPWQEVEQWWVNLAQRLGVGERVWEFFKNALGHEGALERVRRVGGNVHYLLFVVLRYWIPAVLPPAGRERLTKNDPDYWLESEQILRAAVVRLRQLKPLIELLTAPNPIAQEPTSTAPAAKPVVEVELARMLEGIAEVAGSYGGPDYTSVIKHFDPIPLRQTQPFKHNKRNSAELWVIFLLREHFRALGLGKDRYWPLIAEIATAAGIVQQTGQPHSPDDLKSWWQKNWPRTYTQLEQHTANPQSAAIAYHQDFEWFRGWWEWQMSRSQSNS